MALTHSSRIAETGNEYSSGQPSGRKRAKPPIPESALWRLWQRRAALQEWFRTDRGQRVRVLYPGRPGRTAGPDFRNALLHFEELGLVQGDVEIHLRQQDWNSHGHQDDPNYNGVVLHAALDLSSTPTHRHDGGDTPVVSLSSLLPGETGSAAFPPGGVTPVPLWDLLTPLGYPQPANPQQLGEVLDRAGDARFWSKSARFQKFLAEQGPEQVLYEGLLESLGYRQNQQPFVALAGRAPYQALARAALPLPAGQRANAIETWLLHLSGLNQAAGQPNGKLPRSGFRKPLSPDQWHLFRVRPPNHPRRRISGAARLLARCLEKGLLETMTAAANGAKPGQLTSALTVSQGKIAYIGPGRAREMAVNVVLPFTHALASTKAPGELGERFLALYHQYGKLPDNEIVREFLTLLTGPSWARLKLNARRQQGLMHLQKLLAGSAS